MCLHGTGETVRARAGGSAPAGPPTPSAAHRPWPKGFRRVADLSHTLSPGMPSWDEDKPVRETLAPPAPEGEFGFYVQRWSMSEHTGTHLDAPGHVIGGGRLVPDIDPGELVAPAAVIDIRARAAEDPDTTVTVDDIRAFERLHGRIPAGAAVLMCSGWSTRWAEGDERVRGTAEDGSWHFPGFSPEACEFLVSRRGIAGTGVDTLSTDPGNSTEFPAHEVVGRADRWGLEALTGLEQLPPSGAMITVGVLPGLDASGGPSRVLALW
ncbi:cyclase [Nocardiopsis terrae]|uniref:Kynurenine formamidase n=1 Tax=Nocardiopsis terrae TaxID=372655 RepID=A0ABR9HF02_9ACTN|nr:cyclase family protein [Nocardiopsis terrae]MBE1457613.1 kynurenine formamidase [Nocardiopsis terrae]GHC85188.1 cyclase [Nocardiopsis terrae]